MATTDHFNMESVVSDIKSSFSGGTTFMVAGREFTRRGALNADMLPVKFSIRFKEMVHRYETLQSTNEYLEWIDEYTILVLQCYLHHPEALHSKNTLLMHLCPTSSLSREVSWEIVERMGIIQDLQFKKSLHVGIQAFNGLLRAGDLSAFELVRRHVLYDGLHPSPSLNSGLAGFVRWVCGFRTDHEYRSAKDAKVMNLGLKWENICVEIARQLYGNVLLQATLTNGRRPDIIPISDEILFEASHVKFAPLIIECKKSAFSTGVFQAGPEEKYGTYCDLLEIWILEEYGRTHNLYVSPESLLERLSDMGVSTEHYRRQIEEVRKMSNEEWAYFDMIETLGCKNASQEVIDSLISLVRLWRPIATPYGFMK